MAILNVNSASFGDLSVSGSTILSGSSSRTLQVQGSGSAIFTISGSSGGIFEVGEGIATDVFTITSASVNLLNVAATKTTITGSLGVSGPINAASFTGSLFGSSSYAVTASYAMNGGGGAVASTLNYYNPFDAYLQVAGVIGQGSLQFQPMQVQDVAFDRVMVPINYSNASNSSFSMTVSMWMGTYTKNISTLSLVSSVSVSYNITNSGTVGSYSNYGGMRLLSIPMGATNTLAQGQYYVGMLSRTTTGGGAGMTMSNMQVSQINSSFSGIFGQASAVTAQYTRGLGMYSATTNAMPSSVGFNQLTGNSSAYLRQPIFYMVNGTV